MRRACPRTSSATPSAKYSSSGRPRFSKGSTASRFGPAVPASGRVRNQANSTPKPSRRPKPSAVTSAGTRRPRIGIDGASAVAAAPAADTPAGTPPADGLTADTASARANSAAVANRSAGRLGERPGDRLLQRLRHALAQGTHVRHRLQQALGENGLRGGPGERRLPGQHLVEHAAERVDIRTARPPGPRSPAQATCRRVSRPTCRSR